jgi:hypothetical protein
VNGAALLDTLTGRGVKVWAQGGRLELDAPAGALDVALLESLRSHKPELLALLTEAPAIPRQNAATLPTTQNADTAYLDGIALTWPLLTATEALAAVSPPTDQTAWDAAHDRYRAASEALLAWMAATRPTDPAMAEETWTAVHARLEAIREGWRTRQTTHAYKGEEHQ